MKFSVIMASRLVPYPSAGKQREEKLLRAVDSIIDQTFEDWELHIIADGCQRTVDLIQENVKDTRIHLWKIDHVKLWAGTPRNTGIDQSLGDWIIYLDNDDAYGEDHLQIVNDGLLTYDWVWFNDIRYRVKPDYWYENQCDIQTMGKHGTSNIAHKRDLEVRWNENGKYAHDYEFVRKLLVFKNGGKIRTPQYFVCHIPGIYDV